MPIRPFLTVLFLVGLTGRALPAADPLWAPVPGRLMTPWAAQVNPTNALPEYPRPQMVRKEWLNLNGLWEFAVAGKDDPRPQEFPQRILVPFPPESALSGVRTTITERQRLWYRRSFQVPGTWKGQRVLLHFGAVDFEASVRVNGTVAGQHKGGYDGFTFDITDLLAAEGNNELLVSAWDPADAGPYARGKQVRHPQGNIFYTGSSGIWQTVWVEPVPTRSIAGVKLTPDVDAGTLRVEATLRGATNITLQAVALADGKEVAQGSGPAEAGIALRLPNARLWSPEEPFLYDLKLQLRDGDEVLDTVASYFGMRTVAVVKDDSGFNRIHLNNRPCFMLGLLDQGFWPDGLYTAPTDAALRYDIEITRQLGFNCVRKHVKVEPDRWYYWADKLGLLVWQDMPSGDATMRENVEVNRSVESASRFEAELRAMVAGRFNHPSVVLWCVFNEGWGEYNVPRLVREVKDADPTRLVIGASGWVDRPVGDVRSFHSYPGPGVPRADEQRAAIIGEFGGIGLTTPDHTWTGKTWGHREARTVEALGQRYAQLLGAVGLLRQNQGLSGAIYTQLTDVEQEGNGLLTYDRVVLKLEDTLVKSANGTCFGIVPPESALNSRAGEQ